LNKQQHARHQQPQLVGHPLAQEVWTYCKLLEALSKILASRMHCATRPLVPSRPGRGNVRATLGHASRATVCDHSRLLRQFRGACPIAVRPSRRKVVIGAPVLPRSRSHRKARVRNAAPVLPLPFPMHLGSSVTDQRRRHLLQAQSVRPGIRPQTLPNQTAMRA
jgi:hypothetical protein